MQNPTLLEEPRKGYTYAWDWTILLFHPLMVSDVFLILRNTETESHQYGHKCVLGHTLDVADDEVSIYSGKKHLALTSLIYVQLGLAASQWLGIYTL